MKVSRPEQIRNVALLSHGSVGKTSFVEALLYKGGVGNRLGRVEDGTTLSDFTPEEKNRQLSINASFLPCFWEDTKFNFIDTPGYIDFIAEVQGALRIVENALILICAASGVEVNTRRFWKMAQDHALGRFVFINKMDRESANFEQSFSQLQEVFGKQVLPLFVPMGAEDQLQGVMDVLNNKAHVYKDWGEYEEVEIPAEFADTFEEYRMELVEALAEVDDELMMKYLDEEELTQEELHNALSQGYKEGTVIPVFAGSALKGIGITEVLQYGSKLLKTPLEGPVIKGRLPESDEEVERKPTLEEPLSALVAKTMVDPYVGRLNIFRVFSGTLKADSEVYNASQGQSEKVAKLYYLQGKDQENASEIIAGDIGAVAKLQKTSTSDTLCEKDHPIVLDPIDFARPTLSMAIRPKAEGDEDKIGTALNRFSEEDPTFKVEHNVETKELIVSGMGTMHIDVLKDVSKRKFNVDFETTVPKVAYKETIQKKIEVEEKHKKQTGGRGQFGHVHLRVEPLSRGEGFQFAEEIFGGAIPNQYIPGVEKGIRESMDSGVLAGYPVVDFKATVFDGSYHPVDSSEMAFKLAASKGFKKALQQAEPVLLEPVMEIQVEVAEEFMGDVMGDLNSKRGKILGMDPQDGIQIIRAQVPLSEMGTYATDLKSITGGQGTFTMEFSHHDKVPPKEAEKIIAEAQKEKEE